MTQTEPKMDWEKEALYKFNRMIERLPLFHRQIAKDIVIKKALLNAQDRGSKTVEEGDILRAFFSEVPMTFYSMMIRLFEEVGFHYRDYEPKNKEG
jgi:hypothetical protein